MFKLIIITIIAVATIALGSTTGLASTPDAPSTSDPASIIGAVSTMDAAAALNYEIFEGAPLWFVIGLAVTGLLLLALLLTIISLVFNAGNEVEKKEHHEPTPHEVVVELQKELLKSMKETSRQNRLMIWLTIIFIIVSVLGGTVVLNYFQNVGNFSSTWIAQFIGYIQGLLSQ